VVCSHLNLPSYFKRTISKRAILLQQTILRLRVTLVAEIMLASTISAIRHASLPVGVSGVFVELVLVDVIKLRTPKAVRGVVENRTKLVLSSISIGEETRENVGKALNEELRSVAQKVVALQEGCSIENASSEHGRVYASERVNGSSVAANAQEFWVLARLLQGVKIQVWDGVEIRRVACIPVVRNTLVSTVVHEFTVFAGNTIEGLQDFTVKSARGILRGLVGHEAVYERPRSRLGDHTREGRVDCNY
jgi:hypothetical protein